MKQLLCITLVSFILSINSVNADTSGIQLSIINPVQLVHETDTIAGLRLNLIYSSNESVRGLDLGLVNNTIGDHYGGQLGLVNLVGGNFKGIQEGFFNKVDGEFYGIEYGAINIVKNNFNGLQIGYLYNSVGHKMDGVQIGLVNTCGILYGLQIGLLNFNESYSPMGFLPIINFSF